MWCRLNTLSAMCSMSEALLATAWKPMSWFCATTDTLAKCLCSRRVLRNMCDNFMLNTIKSLSGHRVLTGKILKNLKTSSQKTTTCAIPQKMHLLASSSSCFLASRPPPKVSNVSKKVQTPFKHIITNFGKMFLRYLFLKSVTTNF